MPISTQPAARIKSPWGSSFAGRLDWQADVFGITGLMSREQALTIPGVARGLGILFSLIADKPLVDYTRDGDSGLTSRSPSQPAWLYRTSGWAGPYQRMKSTIDDHVFYGEALWGCVRGVATSGLRPILDAWHIPYDRWQINTITGAIETLNADGVFVTASDDAVIYLPASSEGLLAYASRTLRGALDLEQSWIARAKNPIPALDLHETEEANLDDVERQELVDEWAAARADINGSIASTPHNIEARVLGTIDSSLYIEGRNAVRLDIANHFHLPAALLDATTATASLTYVTTETAQSSVDSMTIPFWARPIEDRLGQDDVAPRGHVTRFAFHEAPADAAGPIVTGTAAREIAPIVGAPEIAPIVAPDGMSNE